MSSLADDKDEITINCTCRDRFKNVLGIKTKWKECVMYNDRFTDDGDEFTNICIYEEQSPNFLGVKTILKMTLI